MDGNGRVRIAGLGTAFTESTIPAADVDRPFHDAAPELIDPRRWGSVDTRATMASDVYAFAVLALEVRGKLVGSVDKPLNEADFAIRFSLGDLPSPTEALSQGFVQCRMNVCRRGPSTPNSLIGCGR